MSKAILPLANTPWIRRELDAYGAYVESLAKRVRKPSSVAYEGIFKSKSFASKNLALLQDAEEIGGRVRQASLQAANGAPANAVRELYWRAAEPWVSIFEAIDFRPREFEDPGWGSIADANETAKLFGGEIIERKGQYARCRWMAIPQPFVSDVPNVFIAAAISGDGALAKRLANAYQVYKSHQLTAQFEIRHAFLRHLLADDRKQASQLVIRLQDGYPIDFPPEPVELPRAVFIPDANELAAGLKAISTRFRSKWDEAYYRKRFEKFRSRRPSSTWDQFADRVRSELVGLKWATSVWALAFCNIAAWQGIQLSSVQRKGFSPWIREDLSGL